MSQYTVKDNQTGKTVTFEWHGTVPPTDADMESVFAAARESAPPAAAPEPASVPNSIVSTAPKSMSSTVIDKLVDWLPAEGGTLGGIVGSVPGALLGGAAGEAYKELINRARGRTAPDTSVEAAKQIGTQAAVQGGPQAAGEYVIGPAMKAVGERFMQSAVKPTLQYLKRTPGQTPQVVKTLLDEGIDVTPGGLAKLQALLDSNQQDIADALAPVAKKEIAALPVASRLSGTAQKFAQQVNPQADLNAISSVGENFLDNPAITSRGTLTLADAQALKSGTYRQVGSKYGQLSAAGIEAEKALARGLKEDIAKEVPDISGLNVREGRLLDALSAVGRRAALAGNKDPVGFAWVAHNPTTFLAALIDRNPAVKSFIARGLYSTAGKFAQVSPVLIRTAVQSLSSEDPSAGETSNGPADR